MGLAPAAETNPLASTPTPALRGLLGGPLTVGALELDRSGGTVLAALDAGLGVPGLPQSATGQTALFTGVNAPAALGRHVTAFPGARLKEILARESVFRRAAERGLAATFANPFTPGYLRRIEAGGPRLSASTHAVAAGGLRFRDLDDLARDRAVTWDVERDHFAERIGESRGGRHGTAHFEAPVSADAAGHHLAELAGDHRLTLYETFLTDLAGHRRWELDPADAVRRLDGLLAGLVEHRPADLTVVLTSDHGNLEDGSHTMHTANPVPLLAVGPAADRFAGLARIDQVAGRILEVLAG